MKEKYLCLETYRKNGRAVKTPVWFVESKGILYVRTSEKTGKVKRIRNNPDVRIVPCSMLGKPKGTWIKARADLSPAEEAPARNLLRKKYGFIYWLVGIFYRRKSVIIALHPL